MTTLTIRHAWPEELDAVGELTLRAFVDGGHIHPEDVHYAPVLRDAADRVQKAELLVAVEGDKVLGSVTLARHGGTYADLARPGELEFRMLATAPEASGRGVGRSLVQAVVDRAHEDGCVRVVMCSQESMTIAHRLYRTLGFHRLPDRDWEPVPGLHLLTFGLELEIHHEGV
jgi:ribosomal protein S18 acetylase RimI-like enzyme